MSILQWNVRGLLGKRAECKPFLSSTSPLSVCLQETHFRDNDRYNFTIPGYSLYTKNVNANTRQGGVAMYVLNTIPTSLWNPITNNTTSSGMSCEHKQPSFHNIFIIPPTKPSSYWNGSQWPCETIWWWLCDMYWCKCKAYFVGFSLKWPPRKSYFWFCIWQCITYIEWWIRHQNWLRARMKAERVFAEYDNFLKLSDRPTDRPTDRDAFQRPISFEPSYRLTNGFRHLKATFNKSFVLAL